MGTKQWSQHRILICIPVYNEEKSIEKCLLSIKDQIFNEFDILLIASGCTDRTIEFANKIQFYQKRFHIIEEPIRLGKADAINTALAYAQKKNYELLIFTDGDVVVTKNAITELVRIIYSNPRIVSVTGHPITKNDFGFLGKLASENCSIWNETRKRLNEEGKVWVLSGYLYAIRVIFVDFLVPQECINEDAFLGLQVLKKDLCMVYSESSFVIVKFPSNICDFLLQKIRTHAGWQYIKRFSPKLYRELKKTQYSVAAKRILGGNIYSFFALGIDWFLERLIILYKKKDFHIWKSVNSTKGE